MTAELPCPSNLPATTEGREGGRPPGAVALDIADHKLESVPAPRTCKVGDDSIERWAAR